MPKITNDNTVQKTNKYKLVRTGLDLESVTPFPSTEVPLPTRSSTPFRELLLKIGKGQAIFLTDSQVSLGTASHSLRRLLIRTEFKDYKVTRRTVNGEKRLYIIHE